MKWIIVIAGLLFLSSCANVLPYATTSALDKNKSYIAFVVNVGITPVGTNYFLIIKNTNTNWLINTNNVSNYVKLIYFVSKEDYTNYAVSNKVKLTFDPLYNKWNVQKMGFLDNIINWDFN